MSIGVEFFRSIGHVSHPLNVIGEKKAKGSPTKSCRGRRLTMHLNEGLALLDECFSDDSSSVSSSQHKPCP